MKTRFGRRGCRVAVLVCAIGLVEGCASATDCYYVDGAGAIFSKSEVESRTLRAHRKPVVGGDIARQRPAPNEPIQPRVGGDTVSNDRARTRIGGAENDAPEKPRVDGDVAIARTPRDPTVGGDSLDPSSDEFSGFMRICDQAAEPSPAAPPFSRFR